MTTTILQKFSPLNKLDTAQLGRLSGSSKILTLPEGKIVFKRETANKTCYWLVSGAVDLLDDAFKVTRLEADTERSKKVLDDSNPYKITAITTTESRILAIDAAVVTESLRAAGLSAADNKPASQPPEADAQIDWMSALLESHLFELVPPANIRELFNRFEEVNLKVDDKVIVQGEPGDYFYVIKEGRVRIDKTVGEKSIKLAEAGPGDFFGEDALVRDAPRNATITMLTSGSLMRLGKGDFQGLLQKPTNEYISIAEVEEARASGEQKLMILDVRDPGEFQAGSIKSAVNVPLPLLRKNLHKLRRDTIYICACDGGHRGELAAFILNKEGFDAFILKQ